MDITKADNNFRGPLLIIGLTLLIMGIYFFPTRKHRKIINALFLLPLVFTFAVTVLIPFASGIFYSLTDWNGIDYTKFVGFSNYITMF